MSNNATVSRVENENVLVLERIFEAPRELVFKVFSEAEHLKHWWGPRGWEVPVCKVDFQPGGVWHYCMKCMDKNQGDFYGMESWGKGIYQEIVAPEKIVYIDYFSDAEGNVDQNLPSTEVTLEFVDLGNGTTKLVNRAVYVSAEALKTVIDMGMLQGVSETWDRLEEHLNAVK
ncbi:SRPBCC domain-containing protein [Paenibacillus silvisoli]|uniref:SRPBCC domain-containing protein n=1 Tax=Paenibacillus silvisoli TaxID=3110539 RepID=UPI002803D47D|nr:SRPBCC domain-containing protein [Paenibacillus silvisoli]